jgi:hypothetical protein
MNRLFNIKTKLTELGQEHLLRFYDELDDKGKDNLLSQLEGLDY